MEKLKNGVERTTVVLPPRLKELAMERARTQGISFGELVRRALEEQVSTPPGAKKTGDPFWDNLAVYDTEGPTDVAENHDDYLYGKL